MVLLRQCWPDTKGKWQSVPGFSNFYTICQLCMQNRAKLIVGSLAFFNGLGIAPALDETRTVHR